MTPEEQQQQEEQKKVKKPSYTLPIALGALGAGTALAGGLLISPRMRAAAQKFIGADDTINGNLSSNPVKDLNTYIEGGSDMASGKILGVIPVPTFMKGVRLSQFTPEQWRYWNPDTASHYTDFAHGPASGYFRFLQEHVDSEKDYHTGRSLIPSFFNPTWWAKRKIEGLPGKDKVLVSGATDNLLETIKGMKGKYDPTVVARQLQDRFKEMAGGVQDLADVPLDQQRKLFPKFDDYVKQVDPNLWKQKYLTDFTQGASRIPSSLNSYVDLVKPVTMAQNALVGGGAALAGVGGIWAIIKAHRAAKEEEQRKQQEMLKGAATIETPSDISRGWSDSGGRLIAALNLGLPIISPHHLVTSAHEEKKHIHKKIKEIEAGAPEGSLDDVVVRTGGGAPIKDFIRAWTRKNSTIGDKAFGTIGLPGSVIANIMRSDHYSPHANSVTVHGASPSILSHELGHAIDFNTVAGNTDGSLGRSLYQLAYAVPFANLWHEGRANQASGKAIQDSTKMTQTDKDILESERVQTLPAAYSTYLMGNMAKVYPPAMMAALPVAAGTKLVTMLVGAKMRQKAEAGIKKEELDKSANVVMSDSDFIKEHTELVKILKEKDPKKLKKEMNEQGEELSDVIKKKDLSKTASDLPWRDRVELFALNKDRKVLGGYYEQDKNHGVFGGGVDGEAPEVAAAREFKEEAGWPVENVRMLPVDPVTHEWKPPYASAAQEERAKQFRGSRTLFATGDIPADAEYEVPIDPSGLKNIKFRRLVDALRGTRVDRAHSPETATARRIALMHLINEKMDKVEKVAALTKNFKLVFYKNRSTPQVVKGDEEASPKTGYGEIVGKRDATEKEVATIMKGRWLRKDEQDNDPKSKDYKQTKMRPHLLKKKANEAIPSASPVHHVSELTTEASHAVDGTEKALHYVPKVINTVTKFTTPAADLAESSSLFSKVAPALAGTSKFLGKVAPPLAIASAGLETASLINDPQKAMDDVHANNDNNAFVRGFKGFTSPIKTTYTGAVDTGKMVTALGEQNQAENRWQDTKNTLSKTREGQIALMKTMPMPAAGDYSAISTNTKQVPGKMNFGVRNQSNAQGVSGLPNQSSLPNGMKVASYKEASILSEVSKKFPKLLKGVGKLWNPNAGNELFGKRVADLVKRKGMIFLEPNIDPRVVGKSVFRRIDALRDLVAKKVNNPSLTRFMDGIKSRTFNSTDLEAATKRNPSILTSKGFLYQTTPTFSRENMGAAIPGAEKVMTNSPGPLGVEASNWLGADKQFESEVFKGIPHTDNVADVMKTLGSPGKTKKQVFDQLHPEGWVLKKNNAGSTLQTMGTKSPDLYISQRGGNFPRITAKGQEKWIIQPDAGLAKENIVFRLLDRLLPKNMTDRFSGSSEYRVHAVNGKAIDYATVNRGSFSENMLEHILPFRTSRQRRATQFVQQQLDGMPSEHKGDFRKLTYGMDVGFDKSNNPFLIETNPNSAGSTSGWSIHPYIQDAIRAKIKGTLPNYVKARRAIYGGAAGIGGGAIVNNMIQGDE